MGGDPEGSGRGMQMTPKFCVDKEVKAKKKWHVSWETFQYCYLYKEAESNTAGELSGEMSTQMGKKALFCQLHNIWYIRVKLNT